MTYSAFFLTQIHCTFFLTSDGSSFIIVKYLICKLGLVGESITVCECNVCCIKNARIIQQ